MEITARPAGRIAEQAALIAAVRDEDETGRFTGVLVAVIRLSSLRPSLGEAVLPEQTAVALTDREGRLLTVTDPGAFAEAPHGWTNSALQRGGALFEDRSRGGQSRIFAGAP